MLSNTLTTNEVKNSAGVEVEFQRLSTNDRDTEFAQVGEAPSLPHRIRISHTESGKGTATQRRSRIGVYKDVDTGAGDIAQIQAYCVLNIPTGKLATYDEVKNCLAELLSFMASNGADTAIKFDCSGNGASAAVNGTL